LLTIHLEKGKGKVLGWLMKSNKRKLKSIECILQLLWTHTPLALLLLQFFHSSFSLFFNFFFYIFLYLIILLIITSLHLLFLFQPSLPFILYMFQPWILLSNLLNMVYLIRYIFLLYFFLYYKVLIKELLPLKYLATFF
jgi:hypothetical protein